MRIEGIAIPPDASAQVFTATPAAPPSSWCAIRR
jgi:hypothetical protein